MKTFNKSYLTAIKFCTDTYSTFREDKTFNFLLAKVYQWSIRPEGDSNMRNRNKVQQTLTTITA